MKYCGKFKKFCDGDCLECYDHIGELNREQYKFALKKRESDRIEKWIASRQPLNLSRK
jgi:hypothetical protein